MTNEQQQELGKTLWSIANDLRGQMNADDFRDYMLSFIFLKYLSDNYVESARGELGSDYPTIPHEDDENKKRIIPLKIWYNDNPDDIKEFEEIMRRRMHYVIHPDYLWDNIAELARMQDDSLLDELEKSFKHIEEESFDNVFQGLFSEINLNSEKLGKEKAARNDKICAIITKIHKGMSDFSKERDIIGDAYEYLLSEFAAGSGKSAGEFYTPQPVSNILSAIVTLDSQDPTTGKRSYLANILDFACGSGSLLLNVRHQMGARGVGKVYGQESNVTTYNLARMNMLLHGMNDSEFEIFHGDSLKNDWGILKEANPAKKMRFDAVVANPPFSLRWTHTDILKEDVRFKSYGKLAPQSAADFAFLLHGFNYLKDDGTMAVILPHGVLFRGNAEEGIRTKLLKDGHIDAVIGLPSNLFYSTGIPVCILVLKKCKKYDDVLFINASEHFEKGKRQDILRDQDQQKIIQTYKERQEEERYSRRVSMEEIEKNNFNLNISRYVSTTPPEPEIILSDVLSKLKTASDKANEARNRHNEFLKELGLDELP